MSNDKITVTEAFLEEYKTKNGAWTRRQLEIIGVKWPPRTGWKRKVIGLQISKECAADFKDIALKTFNPKSRKDLSSRVELLENKVIELEEVVEKLLNRSEGL